MYIFLNHKMYAYVTLCMKGTKYVPGVLALATSIRMSGSVFPLVCMVTSDVPMVARELIATVAVVHEVPKLQYRTKPMKSSHSMRLYKEWYDESYTKWNCLNLTQYTKVLFIDADMIIIDNVDHLFDLQAPAATFSTPWATEFDPAGSFSIADYPTGHADRVPAATIARNLITGGYTFIASLVLLEPAAEDYNKLLDKIQNYQPFGFDNYSSPDEQSLAWYYITKNTTWTHIHQRYNFIIHKLEWLDHATPAVLHYFSHKKPWLCENDTTPWFTDKIWWFFYKPWSKKTDDQLIIPKLNGLHKKYFPWLHNLALHPVIGVLFEKT